MLVVIAIDIIKISIHALREEGDICGKLRHCRLGKISIHALREEGDSVYVHMAASLLISIHALREEGDRTSCCGPNRSGIFLSTPSARRATKEWFK